MKLINPNNLLAKADMATRWDVSTRVVDNWSRRDNNFPKPIVMIANGSMPIFLIADVLVYEQSETFQRRLDKRTGGS